MNSGLRKLPSVDRLLQTEEIKEIIENYGIVITKREIVDQLNEIRAQYKNDQKVPNESQIIDFVAIRVKVKMKPTLRSVINATGVVLHTNLGRSPLCSSAISEIKSISESYSTLEFNLENGKRGKREKHAESLLCEITGAESAFVVNNNASAVLLILGALAKRRKVVISRTQLVEIGGGFRIPEVMKQSGARLFEIGTTNRVSVNDYKRSLIEKPALFLRAHHSNFKIIGFTAEPDIRDIVAVAHENDIPVVDDIGSGALINTEKYGLGHEPTVQESIKNGVDIISFSGDKLLGGPQAGIIIGKKIYIDKIKRHPFARAVRPDKISLAALSATLFHYLIGDYEENIPIWKMISQKPEALKIRVEKWKDVLRVGNVITGESTIGGGSLPQETLPTYLFGIKLSNPQKVMLKLRQSNPPIIARVDKGELLFDPRTIYPEQDGLFINILKNILK